VRRTFAIPFLSLALVLSGTAAARADDPAAAEARELIERLSRGDFAAAEASFDDGMKRALPAAKLEEIWKQLTGQVGPLVSIGEARRETLQGIPFVTHRCTFRNAPLDVRVGVTDGKISALFFAPAAMPDPGPPAYAERSKFDETALTVGAEGFPLPAVLAVPKGDGPFPAVVLVHGSGPQDADESIGGSRVFRDIAWGLASRGIAVLRYEKRTHAFPERWKLGMTVEEEALADAVAGCAKLRAAPRVDGARVFVLGHSLGAMLAPEIARRDGKAAGVILLAAGARPLADIIVEQAERAAERDGVITEEELRAVHEIQDGRLSYRNDPTLVGGRISKGVPIDFAYLRALDALDPVAGVKALGKPALILQGGRDVQVSPLRDFLRFERELEKPLFRGRLYPKLNHLFVPGEGPFTPDEYNRPGHVDEQVVGDVAGWILTGELPPR
jgi:pimeloyl-ACP methyl ester carboxylesterase